MGTRSPPTVIGMRNGVGFLTHAEMLLAKSPDDFAQRKAARELPTCPPVLEGKGEKASFAHRREGSRSGPAAIPHHAAPFAPTRWTNLYFPTRLLFWGDPIGGSLAPLFGAGIRDVPVATPLRWALFSHTLYWSLAKGDRTTLAVDALRRALALANDQASVPDPGEELDGGRTDD